MGEKFDFPTQTYFLSHDMIFSQRSSRQKKSTQTGTRSFLKVSFYFYTFSYPLFSNSILHWHKFHIYVCCMLHHNHCVRYHPISAGTGTNENRKKIEKRNKVCFNIVLCPSALTFWITSLVFPGQYHAFTVALG